VKEEKIENQIYEIERFCRENDIELLKVFQDVGVSGAKPAFERDGFRQLIEATELLDVKTRVVYDLTRLGRDLFDLVETYKKLLALIVSALSAVGASNKQSSGEKRRGRAVREK